jgi:hypothetical protein
MTAALLSGKSWGSTPGFPREPFFTFFHAMMYNPSGLSMVGSTGSQVDFWVPVLELQTDCSLTVRIKETYGNNLVWAFLLPLDGAVDGNGCDRPL